MRVAVNLRFLLKDRMEGIARFNYETLKRIVANHPEDEFHFIFDRPYCESFIFSDNVHPVILYPPTRHPLLTVYWLEVRVKNYLRKIKPDVFLTGDTYMPINPGVKTVVVSHDLAFLHYPAHMRLSDRLFYNYFFPKYHINADRIIAVSEYTKYDIADQYKIPTEKIEVVHNAGNGHFYPVKENIKKESRDKLTGGKPYFVYLGSIHPRKNIVNLIKGFEIYKDKAVNEHFLVIIGRPAWKTGDFFNALNKSRYKDYIISTQIEREKLPEYIGSADAMFYVSLFEGFGIPVLEGFEAGIPVVTSNCTSMPEVAGDAALLVDPNSPEAISESMIRLSSDPELCKDLIEKGKKRLEMFSWDRSAEKIYEIIKNTANRI